MKKQKTKKKPTKVYNKISVEIEQQQQEKKTQN